MRASVALRSSGLSGKGLDNLVLITTLAVLMIALLTSVLDARLEARTAGLAEVPDLADQELTQLALHDTPDRAAQPHVAGRPYRSGHARRSTERAAALP